MNANEYFRAGKLAEAIQALNEEVRQNPLDGKRRTFLFELLCFAGQYDRAEKQLDVLSQSGKNAELGTLVYRAALHAERTRHQFFQNKDYLQHPAANREQLLGSWNGEEVQSLSDADTRIGARLEVFAGGDYMWIPFEHIASLEMQPPKRLRDLLWAPVLVRTGPAFKGTELGEVLVPVLQPFSYEHADDQVRLGRQSVWERSEDGEELLFGQKLLLVNGVETPILELRKAEFAAASAAAT